MGRYAFFNTGVKYKFVFGVQPSYDMINFFGKLYYGRDENHLIHKWDKTDIPLILEKLKQYPYNEVDINKYDNNYDGTYKLKWDLEDVCDNYEYILGYIIYHQLQYTTELEVEYEL